MDKLFGWEAAKKPAKAPIFHINSALTKLISRSAPAFSGICLVNPYKLTGRFAQIIDKWLKGGKPAQITLLLRLLCGGYLIYLAWGLYKDGAGGLFLAAGAVFALVGAALLVFTLRTMLRKEDQEDDPPEPSSDDTDNGKDEMI